MQHPISIYTLTDPRDGIVRYVGQTKDPKTREQNHRSKPVNDRMRSWRSELAAAGMEPIFSVVRVVPDADADVAEHEVLMKHRYTVLNNGEAGTGRRSGMPRKKIQRPATHIVLLALDMDEKLRDAAERAGMDLKDAIIDAIAEWCFRRRGTCISVNVGCNEESENE